MRSKACRKFGKATEYKNFRRQTQGQNSRPFITSPLRRGDGGPSPTLFLLYSEKIRIGWKRKITEHTDSMNPHRLAEILGQFPSKTIAVVGDFFLDQYWLIDESLNEPSVETGLDAYQVVGRRHAPGAAGTVVNNLKALGIGNLIAVGFSGVDGEGFELRQSLTQLGVEQEFLFAVPERVTPTYTKPMIGDRELNRFDVKNHEPLPTKVEDKIELALDALAGRVDALIVMDQVSQRNCGVVTDRIREKVAELGRKRTPSIIYADSRQWINEYSDVLIKCNHYEAVGAFYPEYDRLTGSMKHAEPDDAMIVECGKRMSAKTNRPVFVTLGVRGQYVIGENGQIDLVPAVKVEGPIDICGAGDATTSGIVASLCTGATLAEAAAVGNRVSSITIRKLGTTGTATPEELLREQTTVSPG